jgi:hypothetical protein
LELIIGEVNFKEEIIFREGKHVVQIDVALGNVFGVREDMNVKLKCIEIVSD